MNWWIAIKKFFSELPYDNLGDIGTFILSVVSVFTAIVTTRMLIKQHKLQQEQHQLEQKKHELEQKKLEVQQLEHQPVFFFKRNEDSLEICNNGTKLLQPIRFTVRSMIYIELSVYFLGRPMVYVACFPIRIYNDCRAQAELEGVVARCLFNKDEREALHIKCSEIVKGISTNVEKRNLQTKYAGIAGLTIRESDLITISYKDIYKEQHICYYSDSTLIDEQCHKSIVNTIRSSQYKPNEDIAGIDVGKIVKEALQFRNLKNWQI